MKMIWNEEELKKIKIFLRRHNLKLDENNHLIIYNRLDESSNYFNEEKSNLERLLHYQDRNKILEILSYTGTTKKLIQENPSNPLYFGIIKAISNINPNDASEIFVIFREIITQYIKVIDTVTRNIAEIYEEPELIKEELDRIINSDLETNEELYIKNHMNKIFSNIEYIKEIELFKELIEKNNNNIKKNLITSLNKKYKTLISRKTNLENSNYHDYRNRVIGKINRRRNILPTEYFKG